MSEFGNILRQLRKERGYSQYSLADRLGTSRRIINYYESEASKPPADLLPQLAEVLQVPVSVLLGTEELKSDGRTIDAKFWPKWEQLSTDDKKVVTRLVDSLVEKGKPSK